MAMWIADNGPASNEWTKKTLGWTRDLVGIVFDIECPDYSR
ncbi:hypothetical protein [Sphingomonas sp. PAMC26645]|nr:hypothetical protein [Sphingomonas sp. PAMC26645]